jgi:hyaluronan synthase
MSVRALWVSLFVLLAISLGILTAYALGFLGGAWRVYYTVYLVAAVGHTWYVFILLAKEDLFPRRYRRYQNEKIAVIMPCYNEDPKLLEQALDSVVRAKGNKQIFVVNDGSTNDVDEILFRYSREHGVRPYVFRRNKGKRAALHFAIKHFTSDAPYVVTIDSDTVLDENALVRLVEALKTGRIGAASGNIDLLNESENRLTRMTGAYYWTALSMKRRAQSALGMVACCSGALAGYRTSIVTQVIDDFVNEEFIGERCTYSEDRHLTNLVLKSGYDAVFVSEAVAHTYTPATYRAFLKQQLRWRRGFYQESLISLTFLWRVKPILFFEVLFWELVLPLLSIGIVLLVFINMAINPVFALFVMLPALAVLAVIQHLPLVLFAPRKAVYLLHFTFFSLFVMYGQGIYALFTLRNMGWVTR